MGSETKRRLLLTKWRGEIAERDEQIEWLESVLLDVKYWLHDGLVLHRLVSDPRVLLRKVEDALG